MGKICSKEGRGGGPRRWAMEGNDTYKPYMQVMASPASEDAMATVARLNVGLQLSNWIPFCNAQGTEQYDRDEHHPVYALVDAAKALHIANQQRVAEIRMRMGMGMAGNAMSVLSLEAEGQYRCTWFQASGGKPRLRPSQVKVQLPVFDFGLRPHPTALGTPSASSNCNDLEQVQGVPTYWRVRHRGGSEEAGVVLVDMTLPLAFSPSTARSVAAELRAQLCVLYPEQFPSLDRMDVFYCDIQHFEDAVSTRAIEHLGSDELFGEGEDRQELAEDVTEEWQTVLQTAMSGEAAVNGHNVDPTQLPFYAIGYKSLVLEEISQAMRGNHTTPAQARDSPIVQWHMGQHEGKYMEFRKLLCAKEA